MNKIKYNVDYDWAFKPILGLILVLSSIKMVNYMSLLVKDGEFNILLVLHISLIIICDLVLCFPFILKVNSRKKHKIFLKLANKCNGKIINVHHNTVNSHNYTNLEVKYNSKILKKPVNFFSKQIRYNMSNYNKPCDCEIYEIEEDKLPFSLGSSILTKYSFVAHKNKKIIIYTDKMDYKLSFWDKYFSYIVFFSIIIIEIILGIFAI